MAHEPERVDNNKSGGSFAMGLLAGAAVGVGIGLLFAPKAGYKLRRQIADGAEAVADRAEDGYRKVAKTAGEWAERGKDVAGLARSMASHG